jgi:hypothetical protein
VGFYVSRESWAVAPEVGSSMYGQARALRDLTDFAMVTRQSVADGALGGLRALVLLQSPVLEPAVAQAIEQWVRGGGVLIAADMAAAKLGSRLYDGAAWRQRLLAPVAATDALVRVALNGPAPDRWRLLVGTEADGPWLTGDWFHRERGMEWPDVEGARKRWSGPEPRILLPTRPGADYMLRLDAHLADHSVAAGANEVSVNGAVVGRLDRAGNHSYEFTVPKRALTRSPAVLAIHMKTWSPKKVGQSGDDRELGVALRIVELVRQGARGTAFGTAALQYELDPEAFRAHVRQVGQGWTVYLPGLSTDTERLPMVLAPVLRDTGRYLVGAAPLAAQDGKADGVYSTLTASGVLRYDGKRATVSETPKR